MMKFAAEGPAANGIALMNEGKMLAAIRMAFPGGTPATLDGIWYADTSISDDVVFHDFIGHLGEHDV